MRGKSKLFQIYNGEPSTNYDWVGIFSRNEYKALISRVLVQFLNQNVSPLLLSNVDAVMKGILWRVELDNNTCYDLCALAVQACIKGKMGNRIDFCCVVKCISMRVKWKIINWYPNSEGRTVKQQLFCIFALSDLLRKMNCVCSPPLRSYTYLKLCYMASKLSV